MRIVEWLDWYPTVRIGGVLRLAGAPRVVRGRFIGRGPKRVRLLGDIMDSCVGSTSKWGGGTGDGGCVGGYAYA